MTRISKRPNLSILAEFLWQLFARVANNFTPHLQENKQIYWTRKTKSYPQTAFVGEGCGIHLASTPKEKYLWSNISSWCQWGKRTPHRNKAELLLSGDSFRFPLRRRIENLSSNLTIRMFWTSSFLFRRAGIILSRQRTALIEILQVISVRELDSDVEENSRHVLQQGSWWNFTEWNYKSSVKLSVEKGMERELQTYFLMLKLNFRLEIRKNFLQIT